MAIEVENIEVFDHRMMLAHDYAILNVMQVEPDVRADVAGEPLVPARHANQLHLFPQLVDLRQWPDRQRIGLLDRMNDWRRARGAPYFSALLDCPDDKATLRRHLIQRSDVRLPDGSRDVLRLHDPRVFRHLIWILQPTQLAALLGNVRRWSWQASDGAWRSLANPDARSSARADLLRIDATQWAQLLRLVDTNAVLATLRREAPQLEGAEQLAPKVDVRIAEAEQGFPDATVQDRRLYAEHAVRFGDALYRHPDMQALLAVVRAGKQGYFSACAGLDDETLQAWATFPESAKECA